MTSAVLDYVKNKKALINLIISKNNVNFELYENNNKNNITNKTEENNTDSENDLDVEKEILGTCKFSLNEILTDPDFSNKIFDILSSNNPNTNLGYINVDIKLENSASVEGKILKKTKDKEKQIKKVKFLK